ncbi:Eco57I restriction-modification methylase domain-containing protein [Halorubrum vacuolatum]|uniref:site-specific DNA-methyltransferase (adenine-specific) n=1 Tax=Halorubrum vacuolatum TaxID=63740 RepID=A0A238Y1R0_HALVU|nr:N-6 DNA methylase [Halorubrum vacuolatum]SNR64748.1 Type I restriction enzyme R protein N terminus (HSDR_N) [Halorubrum vacuolatum]
MSSITSDFISSVIEAYNSFYREINGGTRNELDLTPRFARLLFCNETLGWDESDYAQEDDLNDIRFYDEEQNPVIIVEAKRRDRDVEEGIEQAFRYASNSPYVDYFIATNFDRLLLYRRCDVDTADEVRHGVGGELLTSINFERIRNVESGEALSEDIPQEELDAISHLNHLKKADVVNAGRYDNFTFSDRQSVSTDEGFDNLLNSLTTALDDYWMPYTLRAFDEFESRYDEYQEQASNLEQQIETLEEQGHDDDTEIAELESQLAELRDDYEQYRAFYSDYETWVRLSNRQENSDDENRRVFCRESIYVQINKILLIRIAEDKDLVEEMISDGGVVDYFSFWNDFSRYVDRNYVDLFDVASEELSEIYDRLYSRQIFDWELDSDDEDLDTVIKKTFWHLNHFDFGSVDRDVLGHLYEQHLPPEERKELGEFYTPTSVVDLILDRVGYTPDNPIDQPEHDLLDPACGSGTFLVRAAGRLLERLDNRNVPPEEAVEIMQERLWGFDLNPFACHITEMNLLFQIIDLYKEVKDENPDYSLNRFHVYQTDSLRRQTQTSMTATFSDALLRSYERERREADRAKTRENYGYIVMNPPYVRIQNIQNGPAKEDYNDYYSAYHNYDLYLLFIEKASEWLREGGKLGIITSNQFLDSRYGERARELIPQRYRIGEMVNIGDVDVFAHATTYPIIMILTGLNRDGIRSADDFVVDDYRFSYVSVGESMEDWIESDDISGWDSVSSTPERGEEQNHRVIDLLALALPAEWGGEVPDIPTLVEDEGIPVPDSITWDDQPPIQSYPVESVAVSNSDWQFAPADEQEVLNWMEDHGSELRSYGHKNKIERGLRTGKNPVFIVDQETIDEYDIENELIHPILGGRQVKRWEDLWDGDYVVYTPPGTDIDDYPNTKEYYNDGENRDELEDRYCVREQNEDYWALDKPKDPSLFEQTKIVTPDIAYYNNYWVDDGGEFYCLDTTYYIAPNNEDLAWFITGVLNSDLAQFYIRRNAATYRGNYLRYKSEYVGDIPIPDPESENVEDELVESIATTARQMQDLISEYRRAETLLANSSELLDAASVDKVDITRTAYITRIPDSDEANDTDIQPSREGSSVRLNVHQSVDLDDADTAKSFIDLLDALNVTSLSDLFDADYPRTRDGMERVLDVARDSTETTDEAGERLKTVEDSLHDDVYEVFKLSSDHKELVEDRVLVPENPLKSKVR